MCMQYAHGVCGHVCGVWGVQVCVGGGGWAETERHSQAKDNVRCVRAGCVCGMDIPHNLLVFSELIHHLSEQDHFHEM